MSLLQYYMCPDVEAFSTRRDSELPCHVIQAHQTHGTKVALIDRPDYTREELEGVDALITNLRGVAIGARTADCIPVLIADPVHHAVAAVHSGWRGTVARISSLAVHAMVHNFGSCPEDLIVQIGPGIGPDSFQVGEEVADMFKRAGFPMQDVWSFRGPVKEGDMAGGHHIDLSMCVALTLRDEGVEDIRFCGIDTYTDTSFFSARREGTACGRIINAIMLML